MSLYYLFHMRSCAAGNNDSSSASPCVCYASFYAFCILTAAWAIISFILAPIIVLLRVAFSAPSLLLVLLLLWCIDVVAAMETAEAKMGLNSGEIVALAAAVGAANVLRQRRAGRNSQKRACAAGGETATIDTAKVY